MFRPRTFFVAPILVAIAVSGVAQAHPKLVSSTPAANATVTKPGKIELNFSEKLVGAMTGADLTMTAMPAMASMPNMPSMASMPNMAHKMPMKMTGFTSVIGKDGKSLTLLMKHALPTGTYEVTYHAVSTDTHRITGKLTFSVK